MGDDDGRAKDDGGHVTTGCPPGSIAQDLANTILEAMSEIRKDVIAIRETVQGHGAEIVILKKAVHGSDPPPNAGGGGSTTLPSVARQASTASLDVAALRSELMEVREELAKQSRAMGIDLRPLKWLASKDGRATIIRIATALGAGYTALHAAGVFR